MYVPYGWFSLATAKICWYWWKLQYCKCCHLLSSNKNFMKILVHLIWGGKHSHIKFESKNQCCKYVKECSKIGSTPWVAENSISNTHLNTQRLQSLTLCTYDALTSAAKLTNKYIDLSKPRPLPKHFKPIEVKTTERAKKQSNFILKSTK